MFFKKAFNNLNQWWRYVLVVIAVFFGYSIGQIPLILALNRTIDNDPNIDTLMIEEFTGNPNFEIFGINSNMGFALLLMMFVGALTAFFFIFKPLHHREFRSLITPSSRINWGKIFFSFFTFMGLALVLELIAYFMSPESYTFQFQLKMFVPLLLLSILLLPVQTSTEEILFRGYFMQGLATKKIKHLIPLLFSLVSSYFIYVFLSNDGFNLKETMNIYIYQIISIASTIGLLFLIYFLLNKLTENLNQNGNSWLNKNYNFIPLILTSLLFGLIHSMNPEIEKFGFGIMQLYYISAGLTLGLMTIMDDGLELALGMHAATNFVGAVFVGYDNAAVQTDSLLTSTNLNPTFMAVGFLFISIIFLGILSWKYKWKSFSKVFEVIDQSEDIV